MTGRAVKYGNDISTDLIIAGKYTKTLNRQDLVDHVMEDLDPDFKEKIDGSGFVAAGEYFGCGSSREQAVVALKESGVKVIFAKSFSRIFYRNAINISLCLVECDTDKIREGDMLEYTVGDAEVINQTTGEHMSVNPMPPIMVEILQAGGVVNYVRSGKRFC